MGHKPATTNRALKKDLRNWLAFLTLRMDHNAQWEIRANAVHSLMLQKFPQVMCLFDNDRIGIPDSV